MWFLGRAVVYVTGGNAAGSRMVDLTASRNPSPPDPRRHPLPPLEVELASPRGFCAGVRRAIAAVEDALAAHGAPVFVRRPIVHNLAVVRALQAQGAVFVEELGDVPPGAVVVLSAHGVAPSIAAEAELGGRTVYDAVCPLVKKVHREVVRYHRQGRHVLLVGHAGHPEILGTLGQLPAGAATLVGSTDDVARLPYPRCRPIGYAVQTTFSVGDASAIVAAVEARFDDVEAPSASDICYATTNRQAAIVELAARSDAVIVVGERFSSNANRLAEVAAGHCSMVQLVAEAGQLDWSALPPGGGRLAITAAASTPDSSIADIVAALGHRYRVSVAEARTAEETVRFRRVPVAQSAGLNRPAPLRPRS